MSCISILGFLPLVIILVIHAIATLIFQNSANIIIVSIINVILGFLRIIAVLASIYIGITAQIGLLILLKNFSADQKIKEAFKEGRKYFWSYLAVFIITAIFVILWSILFIIPGIIFGVYYAFSRYALIFEDYKSRSALKRSKELIKNYWWAVFGRQLFIVLPLVGFAMILSIPMLFLEEESLIANTYAVFINLIYFIISPIVIIYSVLIYRGLVEIKKTEAEKNNEQ